MAELYEFISSLWVVWLSALFLGILFWVLRPSNKKRLEEHGRIPLDDDEPLPERRGEDGPASGSQRGGKGNGAGPRALRMAE